MRKKIDYEKWEPVIGLEIHAQLNTKTKLFSPAPNRFGNEPNMNISVICTGQPGALPVLNREAVKKAVQFGLAVKSEICKYSTFDRKSYFYPDSPRNFQITQFENPILIGGSVVTEVDGKTMEFAIEHTHLEDDAGMLKHFSDFAGVDYNRAGVPLIEIVSMPCMHTPRQASSYAMAIKAILEFIHVSNCNMEQGSLRMDANVSVRLRGEKTLRPRSEIKNLNSFTFLELALESEIERQIALYEKSPDAKHEDIIQPGTYRWNGSSTELMRKKERADDYRYFPEPDLLPIQLTDAYIEELRESLPELPRERYHRYIQELQLTEYAAGSLVQHKTLSDYFETALLTSTNARSLCNWITVEFAGQLKDTGQTLMSLGITPESIAQLVNLIDAGTINGKIAKSVAADMIQDPSKGPEEIVAANPDYQPLDDTSAIEPIVQEVLKNHPQSIVDYKAGRTKAFAFLVGQVMKQTRGKASPKIVNDLIHKNLDANP